MRRKRVDKYWEKKRKNESVWEELEEIRKENGKRIPGRGGSREKK